MKKKKSDIAIINTWIEDMERAFAIRAFEMGMDDKKAFRSTDRANVFEIETPYGIFKVSFERKNDKE